MLKYLGYLLILIGLAGCVFFFKYRGTLIPLQALWFVLSVFVGLAGIVCWIKYQMLQEQQVGASRLTEIERLRQSGEKVLVTLDNCEVKTRSWQQEIVNDDLPDRAAMLDGLFAPERNFKTEEIVQTYIVYYKRYGTQSYKFISQPTTQSADVVRRLLDTNVGVTLYIDKRNPANYYFDLPF